MTVAVSFFRAAELAGSVDLTLPLSSGTGGNLAASVTGTSRDLCLPNRPSPTSLVRLWVPDFTEICTVYGFYLLGKFGQTETFAPKAGDAVYAFPAGLWDLVWR